MRLWGHDAYHYDIQSCSTFRTLDIENVVHIPHNKHSFRPYLVSLWSSYSGKVIDGGFSHIYQIVSLPVRISHECSRICEVTFIKVKYRQFSDRNKTRHNLKPVHIACEMTYTHRACSARMKFICLYGRTAIGSWKDVKTSEVLLHLSVTMLVRLVGNWTIPRWHTYTITNNRVETTSKEYELVLEYVLVAVSVSQLDSHWCPRWPLDSPRDVALSVPLILSRQLLIGWYLYSLP